MAPGCLSFYRVSATIPITSLAPNGLSQSKVGVSGVEPLGVGDLKGVFKLETGFNPTSGRLTDGPRSLIDNNGRANNQRITASDSSRAGQAFQGGAYVGIASNTFGTLTFGRQNSLMADNLLKYDPQLQAQAFSPIAYSGTSGGLGDTEDKALDDMLKYVYAYGPARVAVLYQFGQRGTVPEGSESVDIGADYAGLSVDALYGKVRGAVNLASLTAAQNTAAPGTLAGTISDNTAYCLHGQLHLAADQDLCRVRAYEVCQSERSAPGRHGDHRRVRDERGQQYRLQHQQGPRIQLGRRALVRHQKI